MIYFVIGFMVGFLFCLAAVLIFIRMDVKKIADEKKERLADRYIIGKDGYIPDSWHKEARNDANEP